MTVATTCLDGSETRTGARTSEQYRGLGRPRNEKEEVIAEEVRETEKWTSILKEIIAQFLGSGILKMGFELTKDSTMEDYAREAGSHPGSEVRFKETSE
jgi:hypothetical protein